MSGLRLSKLFFPWVVALFMGGVVTALVTACLQVANGNQTSGGLQHWFYNWMLAWAIATPVIVIVAPRARALAIRVAIPPEWYR